MKISKGVLLVSAVAAVVIAIVMFATDQDPKPSLMREARDFAGLTMVLTVLMFFVSTALYNGFLFTKGLFKQGHKSIKEDTL